MSEDKVIAATVVAGWFYIRIENDSLNLKQLKFPGPYDNLSYVDGNNVWVMNGKKLVIQTVKGKVNSTSQISVDTAQKVEISISNSQPICNKYISAVQENGNGFIYMTGFAGFNSNQISKLSLKGQVVMVYNDWDFLLAGEISATGDGHVFVCFPRENCIRLVRPDMKAARTVLDEDDGLLSPAAICYCSEERRLYVCNSGSSVIMVFALQ